MPHRLPSTPSEPTLPTPRPLPPRFLPSSSSESVVFRRRPTLLRLAVSCLLGMWRATFAFEAATPDAILVSLGMHANRECQGTSCFSARFHLPDGYFGQSVFSNYERLVMVSPVSTVWPMSRPRSLSSMSISLCFPCGSLASNAI
jgi:hypothetical protein